MDRSLPTREHPEPRWHRRKEDRPAEILDAALHEFVSRGFAATRLEDIAKRAGCTKGTIFLYFASKEELLKALVRENVLPRIQDAEALVERHEGTYRELLEKLLRARWDTIVNTRLSGLPKLMFAEAGNFPELAQFHYDEIIARSHALISRVLRAGIERGEFREHDVDSVARLAITPILVASLWKHSYAHLPHTNIDRERYFDAALDVLMRGIARQPDGGTRA